MIRACGFCSVCPLYFEKFGAKICGKFSKRVVFNQNVAEALVANKELEELLVEWRFGEQVDLTKQMGKGQPGKEIIQSPSREWQKTKGVEGKKELSTETGCASEKDYDGWSAKISVALGPFWKFGRRNRAAE